MNDRSRRAYQHSRRPFQNEIDSTSSHIHHQNNRSIFHGQTPDPSTTTTTATTTTSNITPSSVENSQSSDECPISICYSYLIAIFSSFLVVLGIYLTLTKFNTRFLYLSLLGISMCVPVSVAAVSVQINPYMQVHKLGPNQTNITCNDGSQVGYYMRLNNHSKSWIIYLQGGGFCGSEESCQQRWQWTPHLMSSKYWPKTKTGDGILSSEPKENPYLWNANHIYIPYCSSDSWTGRSTREGDEENHQQGSFSFMGSQILERVFESLHEDLPKEYSLYEAKYILLAGDSAGATGVILNLDKMNEFVRGKANLEQTNCTHKPFLSATQPSYRFSNSGPTIRHCQSSKQAPILRGLADSGWFLDNEPYDYSEEQNAASFSAVVDQTSNGSDCDKSRCTPLQSIRQAMLFWNGQVPTSCANQYPDEPWRCYFGYRAYQTLKTPLFVVQWLYDEAQLMVDHVAPPYTSGQQNYVNKVVDEMRASLENVTALFAPSCFSHSLVVRQSWNQININGFKLPHVLNSWEEQFFPISSRNRYHHTNSARFRLIDSCKRPQCNRDCPDSDTDFNFGGIQL